MPSRLNWSDLRLGLIAFGVIAVSVISILLFARVGALHGKTVKLYVTAPDVSGVLKGTDVSLAGKKIGVVRDIRFRPIASDTLQRVLIETDILAERLPLIRGNSLADIRPGGNLIGSPVVYILPGTLAAREVKPGDTLRPRISGRIAAMGKKVDSLAEDLNAVAQTSEALMDKLSDPANSVGAFRTRGIRELRSLTDVTSSYSRRATTGNGTLALARRGDVQGRLTRLLSARDSIALMLSSGNGNLGRFRRDSTLPRELASVRAGIDSLRHLTSGAGSATRLRSDTALKAEIARARAQIDSLMLEVKKHPLKYISF